MKNSGNIVLGGVLLTIGVIWLLKSLNMFEFYWSDVLGYWYWYLIAAGVLLVIAGLTANKVASSIAGIFITLAVVGGVTKGAHWQFQGLTPFEWRNRKWKDRHDSEDSRPESRRKKSGEVVRGDFGYDMQPDLKTSKLNFSGGAGVFRIEGSTPRLFEANTSSTFVNYVSNIRHNKADQFATVDFKMEDGDIDLDKSEKGENQVNIKLNDQVKWDVELRFGAGEGRFDLSQNTVEKLKMNTGAADVEVKLGEKAENAQVDIKAGVASVKIMVPRSVAVEIVADGALNSTEFPGFVKQSGNRYRSPDYSDTKRKIFIKYQGGLSSLEVDQY